jgi:Ca2+-binding RTX toxin-like protein
MAVFTGTFGADNFVGTAAAGDDFYFGTNALTTIDSIKGGGTSQTDPIDRLFLSGNYIFGIDFSLLKNQYQYYEGLREIDHISGIEQIYLAQNGPAIALNPYFMNGSSNGKLEVFGSIGNDTVTLVDDYKERSTNLIVHGSDGEDIISNKRNYMNNEAFGDQLFGDAGNDIIYGRGNLFGGTGSDIIELDASSAGYGGADGDKIYIFGGNAGAYGGDGGDTIYVYGGYTTSQGATNAFADGGAGYDFIALSGKTLQVTFTNFEGIYFDSGDYSIAVLNQIKGYGIPIITNAAKITNVRLHGGGSFDFSTMGNGTYDLVVDMTYGIGEVPNYNIIGSNGHNEFIGNDFSSDDIFTGGVLSDKIYGGGGEDTIYGGGGNDKLNGGAGIDSIYGGAGDDEIIGYGEALGPKTEKLFGGIGNDLFSVSSGYDSACLVDGGDGYDTLRFEIPVGTRDLRNLSFTSIEGIITLSDIQAYVYQLQTIKGLYTTTGRIWLESSGTLDLNGKITSPNKNLTIGVVADGNTNITASLGDDDLRGSHSNDNGIINLFGADGNDILRLTDTTHLQSADFLFGGNGKDTFYLSNFGDSAFGGADDDLFYCYGGKIDGGSGNDTLIVSESLSPTSITNIETLEIASPNNSFRALMPQLGQFQHITSTNSLPIGITLVGDGTLDLTGKLVNSGVSLTFIAQSYGVHVSASDFSDSILGTRFSDELYGGLGDDYIRGGLGNDYLFGGSGKDNISVDQPLGAPQTSHLYGGADDDVITVYGNQSYVEGGSGHDDITTFGTNNYIVAGSGDDTVEANGVGDIVLGGDGADFLLTNTATMARLLGEGGSDLLIGDDANDYLNGGADNDILLGGFGADTMIGGSGNDIYEVDNVGDITYEIAAGGGTADNVFAYVNYVMQAGIDNLIMSYGTQTYGTGNAENNIIIGNDALNVLEGGKGYDTLTGGLGTDYFKVNAGWGVDVVTDFVAGAHSVDAIVFSKQVFTTFADVLNHAAQHGADTWIGDGLGNTLVLQNILKTNLNSDDFQFA